MTVAFELCFAQNMFRRTAVGFEASYYELERMDSREEFGAVRMGSEALMSDCEDHYSVVEALREEFGNCRSKFEITMGSDVRLREMREKMEIFVEAFPALIWAEESFEVEVCSADESMGRIA